MRLECGCDVDINGMMWSSCDQHVSKSAPANGLCCPKCESKATIYGSECYPDDGMVVECDNHDCAMEIRLSINLRTDKLKDAIKAAWNILAA